MPTREGDAAAPAFVSRAPASNLDIFWTFSRTALQGFGGVLPVCERVLVHERGWLTEREFVEWLGVAQALPGPNVINLAVMVGDRYAGIRGAIAAVSGLMLFPALLVLALTILYQRYAAHPLTQSVLLGMAAVSVGLIAGMSLRMARTQRHYRAGWLIGLATFFLIAILHVRLGLVMLALGIPSVMLRHFLLRRTARS
jgi:chromate transporter